MMGAVASKNGGGVPKQSYVAGMQSRFDKRMPPASQSTPAQGAGQASVSAPPKAAKSLPRKR
jgi:hypothetical protein